MARFRAFGVALAILWLLPAYALMSRVSSTNNAVLGRYTLRYFLILVFYLLTWLGLILVTVFATPRLRDGLLKPIRWLQRVPILYALMAYGLIELWALIHWRLFTSRFFGIGKSYSTILAFAALLELAAFLLLLVAGREGTDLRRVLRNIALTVAASAILLALFSWAVVERTPIYAELHTIFWKYHRLDPFLSYMGMPNQHNSRWPSGYYTTGVSYASSDENGFRNEADAQDAPIAIVGDSIVFGMGLNDEDMPTRQLAEQLGMPIANYGIIGYEPWQHNRVIERYVREAHHDLLIYPIYADDLRTEDPVIAAERRWEILPYRTPVHFTVHNAFDEGSPTVWLVETVREWMRPSTEPPGDLPSLPHGLLPGCSLHSANYVERQTTPYLKSKLDEAVALTHEMGIQLLVITIPSREAIYSEELGEVCPETAVAAERNESNAFRSVCEHAESRGIPCYNMLEDFRREARSQPQPLTDGHLTPEGSAIFAALVADYVTANGLRPQENGSIGEIR